MFDDEYVGAGHTLGNLIRVRQRCPRVEIPDDKGGGNASEADPDNPLPSRGTGRPVRLQGPVPRFGSIRAQRPVEV